MRNVTFVGDYVTIEIGRSSTGQLAPIISRSGLSAIGVATADVLAGSVFSFSIAYKTA